MATLVLGALLGPVGGLVGGVIDSLLIQELFGQDIEGPRLDSLKQQSASEGSPHSLCLGPKARVAGTVRWLPALIEDKDTEDVGGIGGFGGAEVTTYSYYSNVAVSVCLAPDPTVGINRFVNIWANGRLIYDDDNVSAYTSTALSCTAVTDFLFTRMDIKSTDAAVDLTAFRSGWDVVSSGWSNGGNNGTFRVVKTWTGSGSETFVQVRNDDAVTEAAGATVTLTQTFPKFSTYIINSIDVSKTGTDTQLPSSFIESFEGTGTVPAWRGSAYVVIERLALASFGNRLPQLEFLVEEKVTKTIAEAIDDIMARGSKLQPGDWDTSGVTGNLRGYTVRLTLPITKQLAPLLVAYGILTQERDGVLYFYQRENAPVVPVADEDLAAHEFGRDAPRTIDMRDTPSTDLPSEVNITYIDPDLEYQQAAQRFRGTQWDTENIANVQLPLVLTAGEAQCACRRLYWTRHANRFSAKIQLPPSYLTVLENDRLQATAYGETYDVLTQTVERGNNFMHMVEGVVEQDQTLVFTGCPSEGPPATDQDIYIPPELLFYILDIAPLRDEDANQAGFYFATAAADSTAEFVDATLFESTDGGTTYHQIAHNIGESIMGRTTTLLGGSESEAFWDDTNTVNVTLDHGTLSSATDADILDFGVNVALVGDELISFVTATLEADGSYTLSRLIRGARDTQDEIENHAAVEQFVLITNVGVRFYRLDLSARGDARKYKMVPAGMDVADAFAIDFTPQLNTLRPFSPYDVVAERTAGGDVDLRWDYRSRAVTRFLSESTPPLFEEQELYEIDILSGPTVLRTISVADVRVATYTAAQISTDGLSVGTGIDMEFFHVSPVWGRGKVFAVTV